MATFAVFWKNIAESGGADTLNECYIEKGSLKPFISGKGYKKTKRDHQLHALVIEILRFQSFLESMKQQKRLIQLKEKSLTLKSTTAVIWIFRKRCTRFLKNMKNIKRKQRLE